MLLNKVIDLMESFCKCVGDRYMVGFFWKKDKYFFLDNYLLVEKRFFFLEWNFFKDEVKVKLYDNVMMEYERNGWVYCLSEKDLEVKVKLVYYFLYYGIY